MTVRHRIDLALALALAFPGLAAAAPGAQRPAAKAAPRIASSAGAATAAATATAPSAPSSASKPIAAAEPEGRLRGIDGGLARSSGTAIAPGAAAPVAADKRDEQVAAARWTLSDRVGRAASASDAPGFLGAMARLEQLTIARSPRASGRIKVSFSVARNGAIKDPLVVGFDAKLDALLEERLAREILHDVAGQRIETQLLFRAGKPIPR
jgi:hypothetical protein